MNTFAELFERLGNATTPEHNIVAELAARVRKWIEHKASRPDLIGYCAIASAELYRKLQKYGIEDLQLAMWVDDYNNTAHVFLLWNEHVVDITATQFGHNNIGEVEIRPLKEAMNTLQEWQPMYTFDSPAELRHDQLKNGWPDSQVAFAHEMM